MRVIFLDRDGVINKYPGDTKYVTAWKEFKFLPGAKKAMVKLYKKGFKIFIISNQAGVGKGIYSKRTLNLITKNMLKEIENKQIKIAGVYYCTHKPEDNCACRKPQTGLIEMAISTFKDKTKRVNLSKSYFIGYTIRDIETGKSFGLKTVLVFSGKEKPKNKNKWLSQPDFVASDLSAAVNIIIK